MVVEQPNPGGSTRRLDFLRHVEKYAQERWKSSMCFEAHVKPRDEIRETYYVTFPFPYMNGRLHLGHAFSLTKAEFTARFQKLNNRNVLWPFAFHCTGMPIAACADRLKLELETPDRNNIVPVEKDQTADAFEVETTYGSKKSKATAKTDASKTMKDTLLSIGVKEEEIPKFSEASFWLKYFPPLGRLDLDAFGLAVDWRRAFITTNANPYFDSFVRWQFRLLKERKRIKFGLRPAVFSITNGQPSADHDRASGEGAVPQEFTAVKMRILDVPQEWIVKCPPMATKPVYMLAATLRPETMYGQTNYFILPTGVYGVYPTRRDNKNTDSNSSTYVAAAQKPMNEAIEETDFFVVCSPKAALNLSYQGYIYLQLDRPREPQKLFDVTGQDLIGIAVKSPHATYDRIYGLPLPSILMEKGTGVVTSVPSDAPEDYAMLKDLQNKQVIRDAYHVKPEWCDRELVEIIEIPGYGRRSAATQCEEKKVTSWKDDQKLKAIKQEVYLKGFYEGEMLMGPHKGKFVRDVKDVEKEELVASGDALLYFESSQKVISRAGDECVVAQCNQWYSDFGNQEWKEMVAKHVNESFEGFGQLSSFQNTVGWLQGWACSRSYGLGTYLPWDEDNKILIESLSDSTIYFAYYTISHMLQGDMYGATPGTLGLKPSDLTDDTWNYVFCQTDETPKDTAVSPQNLKLMRESFEYWYPMNLRCSGKDLIQNHLTMSLFHHAAIWPRRPDLWPRAFYVNGLLLIDSEKMSKSTGNFLSLSDSIEMYSADATRVALADGGDGIDDGNFEKATVVSGLMRLYVVLQWIEETTKKWQDNLLRQGEQNEIDRMFENQMNVLIRKVQSHYQKMNMRDALRDSFYEFINLKDSYRIMLDPAHEFHETTIMKWIRNFAIVVSPIACHSAEYIWSNVLKESETLSEQARWPSDAEITCDSTLSKKLLLINNFVEDCRKLHETKKGAKTSQEDLATMTVFISKTYPEEQQTVLKALQSVARDSKGNPVNQKWMDDLRSHPDIVHLCQSNKKMLPNLMGFASFKMKDAQTSEADNTVFNLELPFDELTFLSNLDEFIRRSLSLEQLKFFLASDPQAAMHDKNDRRKIATPGTPSVVFS